MDGNRFDSLARTMARGTTRRGAIKSLIGIIAAGVVGGRGTTDAAAQAACPDGQYHDGSRCLCTLTGEPPNRKTGECHCGRGTTECGGACVDIDSDPIHCGACGAVCLGGECRKGQCRCAWGLTECGGVCVDLGSDGANCGACDNPCAEAHVCGGGGQPGVCYCAPATCESLGAGCGAYADGCGGTIPCTACPENQTCTETGCKRFDGETCAAGADCLSGNCAGEVCCDQPCDGACQSCASGTCAGTSGGLCGGDGACGGLCEAGTCVYADSTVVCEAPACTATNEVSEYACDGAGGCQPTVTNCGLYVCQDGACATTCQDSNGCIGEAYCDGGVCHADRLAGASCTSQDQCDTGFCVDGYCCEGACGGQCEACDVAGSLGTCTAVSGSPHGTRTACAGESPCSGTCDGSRSDACTYPATSVSCGASRCVDGITVFDLYCDGAGGCEPTGTLAASCGAYSCDADGITCLLFCDNDTECAPGKVCNDARVCGSFVENGGACTTSADCLSNSCVTGTCLGEASPGAICTSWQDCASRSCSGGYCCDGGCPDNGCATCITGNCVVSIFGSCGPEGPCQGTCSESAECVYPGEDTICDDIVCVDGARNIPVCDGAGTCLPPAASTCGAYACDPDGTTCRFRCASASDCSPNAYCDDDQRCQPLGDLGDRCDDASTCLSGMCVDGVCCDSACTGRCEACDDELGHCSPIRGRPHSGRGDCPGFDINEPCSPFCDGVTRDACFAPGDGTVCIEGSCAGSILTPAVVCDGTGVCPNTAGSEQDCAPYLCDPALTACRESCTIDAHCVNGLHCADVDGTGRCVDDVPLAGACRQANECADGLSCFQATGDTPGLCCPAASCLPCHEYDETCACVPVSNGTVCAAQRTCCGGECCTTGSTCDGDSCSGACAPLGSACEAPGDCCLEFNGEGITPDCFFSNVDVVRHNCCSPVGGPCSNVGSANECCMLNEEVLCAPDGVCGGTGAFCAAACRPGVDPDCPYSVCLSGVCCNFECCAEGQTCFGNSSQGIPEECRSTIGSACDGDDDCVSNLCCDGVCTVSTNAMCGSCDNACDVNETCVVQSDGESELSAECKKTMGALCNNESECASGICRSNVCCDECGIGCGVLQPDNTPCHNGTDGFHCCAGVCQFNNGTSDCNGCNTTCVPGDICQHDLTCGCTQASTHDNIVNCQYRRNGKCNQTTEGNLVCNVSESELNPDGSCGPDCGSTGQCQGMDLGNVCFGAVWSDPTGCTDEWVCAYSTVCERNTCQPLFPDLGAIGNTGGNTGGPCLGGDTCHSGVCCNDVCCPMGAAYCTGVCRTAEGVIIS